MDDFLLGQALRSLPMPEISPDFDDNVLAALHTPRPWWQSLWEPARPLLLGASCSLAVTLIALHWTLSAPLTAPRPPSLGEQERIQAAAPRPLPSLDALLDRPNLSAGSLSAGEEKKPPAPILGSRSRKQGQGFSFLSCPPNLGRGANSTSLLV